VKGDSEACSERQQYVTVTANQNQTSSDTVLVEFGSYTFSDAPKPAAAEAESSVYLMSSIALIAGLVVLL
jgi:hypothetical protein